MRKILSLSKPTTRNESEKKKEAAVLGRRPFPDLCLYCSFSLVQG